MGTEGFHQDSPVPRVIWVVVNGMMYKCSPECVRPVVQDELAFQQLAREYYVGVRAQAVADGLSDSSSISDLALLEPRQAGADPNPEAVGLSQWAGQPRGRIAGCAGHTS